ADHVQAEKVEQILLRQSAFVARLAPYRAERTRALHEGHLIVCARVYISVDRRRRHFVQAVELEQPIVERARPGPAMSADEELADGAFLRPRLARSAALERAAFGQRGDRAEHRA